MLLIGGGLAAVPPIGTMTEAKLGPFSPLVAAVLSVIIAALASPGRTRASRHDSSTAAELRIGSVCDWNGQATLPGASWSGQIARARLQGWAPFPQS